MDPLEYLKSPSDLAFARLEGVNGDLSALPVPVQTFFWSIQRKGLSTTVVSSISSRVIGRVHQPIRPSPKPFGPSGQT